jgi:hypothetical protein
MDPRGVIFPSRIFVARGKTDRWVKWRLMLERSIYDTRKTERCHDLWLQDSLRFKSYFIYRLHERNGIRESTIFPGRQGNGRSFADGWVHEISSHGLASAKLWFQNAKFCNFPKGVRLTLSRSTSSDAEAPNGINPSHRKNIRQFS